MNTLCDSLVRLKDAGTQVRHTPYPSTAYATAYSGTQVRHKLLQLTLLQQVLRYAISCCSFWAYCKCFSVGIGHATFEGRSVNGHSALNLSMKAEQPLVRQSSGTFIPRCTARVSAYCSSCNCLLQLLQLLQLLRRWAFTVPAPGIKVCALPLSFEASLSKPSIPRYQLLSMRP